jgi:hypothetical protein
MPVVTCTNCGTSISIPANARKPMTTCPSCQAPLKVRTFRSAPSIASPVGKSKPAHAQTPGEFGFLRRIGTLQSIGGAILLALGIVVAAGGTVGGMPSGIGIGIFAAAVGINTIVFGQLITVFLTIEQHLRKIAEKP